jgi:hypothetical protein
MDCGAGGAAMASAETREWIADFELSVFAAMTGDGNA